MNCNNNCRIDGVLIYISNNKLTNNNPTNLISNVLNINFYLTN